MNTTHFFDVLVAVQELKNARSFAKEPGPLATAPATEKFYPDFKIGSADVDALMYQPYLRMSVKADMPHKDAYQMIAKQVSINKTPDEQ